MNYSQMREVSEAMRGPFGKWLLEELKEQADAARLAGSMLLPETIAHEYEREHLLARANTLLDLVTQIPSKINERLKELESQEK